MTTIEEFIEARLAEDEAAARRAARFRYDDPSDAPWVRMRLLVEQGVAMTSDTHFARHDPARVLRQVTATRALIEVHRKRIEQGWGYHSEEMVTADLAPLAAIWSDHPDYRQEWTPDQG